MGRSVGRLANERRPAVPGRKAARAITLVALAATWVRAGDGDGPELTPPNEMVIISKPASPAPPLAPATAPAKPANSAPRRRATLALPGITSPATRPQILAEPPTAATGPGLEGPALDAPLEMGTFPNTPPITSGNNLSRPGRAFVVGSSTIDELPPPGGNSARDDSTSKKPTPSPAPVQAPARRPRIFGFLGSAPTPAPVQSSPPRRAFAGDSIPAAESALKRRIERQARDVVGNRARSVEVRLEGKDATIHVAGAKLFQRRPLRKQLEAIPALAGLRSTIEINE